MIYKFNIFFFRDISVKDNGSIKFNNNINNNNNNNNIIIIITIITIIIIINSLLTTFTLLYFLCRSHIQVTVLRFCVYECTKTSRFYSHIYGKHNTWRIFLSNPLQVVLWSTEERNELRVTKAVSTNALATCATQLVPLLLLIPQF